MIDIDEEARIIDICGKVLLNVIDRTMCKNWMIKTINHAEEPLTFAEWIEAGHRLLGDSDYDVDLQPKHFDKELIKSVVFELLKKKNIIRLGKQTFCSGNVVNSMCNAINKVMIREFAVCNMEELAELLFDYCSERDPERDVLRNFIEKKIVTKAIAKTSLTYLKNGDFAHPWPLSTCYVYVESILAGRRWQKMSGNDFFAFVCRVDVKTTCEPSMYAPSTIKNIKEALKHPCVMEDVLYRLEKCKKIRRESQMVLPPEPKSKRFRDLDDD